MKSIRLTSLYQVMIKCICALIGLVPLGATAYTFDENLPDYLSTFQQISSQQTSSGSYPTLFNFHRNANAGGSQYLFPSTWQNMPAGKDLRLKILLPPGTIAATAYIEAASMTASIGACDGVPATCSTAPGRASLSLWPNPPFGGGTLSALTAPRIVSLVIQATGYPFDFSSMTITYYISDVTLYENWRSQRSWAGGKGDCDGLENTYCTGGATPTPVPTTTFSIAASSLQIAAGGTLTLTPTNGTISSCTSSNTAVIPNPTVAAGGASASATVASTVASNSQATITCTSTTGVGAATGVITVTNTAPPPTPSAFSLTQSSQTVKPGGSFTLSALTGSISYCHSDSIGAIPDLTVSADHKTATGTASATALPDNSVKITCFSTKTPSDIATAFVTVIPASTAFTLTPITLKNISSTSVTVNTTASATITGYWVALPLGTTEPTPPNSIEITSGTFSAASGGKSGNKELSAGKSTDLELSGLTANSNYRVYFYAAPSGASGIYQTFNIATILPTPEAISGNIKGSKNNALKLDVTITPASNHTGQGKYYVAAYIPPGTKLLPGGGLWFLTPKNGWTAWSGGNWLEYSQEALSTKTIPVLDGSLDVTILLGTSVYGAYETDAGVKISKEVYTVQSTTTTATTSTTTSTTTTTKAQ